MAKNVDRNLKIALEFRDYLLWSLMGDNMGKKPSHPVPDNTTTFSEKKTFLDSMLKAAELSRKHTEDKEDESGLDLIRKNLNVSAASGSKRDRRAKEILEEAASAARIESGAHESEIDSEGQIGS